MKVGVFADAHDHLDNIRRAVALFNELQIEVALFAGDLVSTFAVPPLRQLNCRMLACYGDNEGNKTGLQGGFRVIGELREAPALYILDDNTRVVLAHMPSQLQGFSEDYDIAVTGHTHRPKIFYDELGRLHINPGETSGWTFNSPTVALLDTATRTAEILPLDTSSPLKSWEEERRARASERTQQS